MARNFMAVAERFGLKTEMIPDEARDVALERAQAGEQITSAAAKEIPGEVRKKPRPKRKRPFRAHLTRNRAGSGRCSTSPSPHLARRTS
jgi:hypothetical protein